MVAMSSSNEVKLMGLDITIRGGPRAAEVFDTHFDSPPFSDATKPRAHTRVNCTTSSTTIRPNDTLTQLAKMKVVGLVSGGKDSCYNLMKCVAAGHTIVAIANLAPPEVTVDEIESHMFQTIGHGVIRDLAQAMQVPFFTVGIQGSSQVIALDYTQPTVGDEVEDLYRLLAQVKEAIPDVEAVASGAILSNYQRLRVEHVCQRLNLISLALLWEKDQSSLLHEMITNHMDAILVKVASMGLVPAKHLGRSLKELETELNEIGTKYGVNVCGEGGEYETLTLDCPLFRSRIVLHETEMVGDLHSNIAPVAVLRIKKWHLEEKKDHDPIAACRAMTSTALSSSLLEPIASLLQGETITNTTSTTASSSLETTPSQKSIFEFIPSSPSPLVFPASNIVADHCFVSSDATALDITSLGDDGQPIISVAARVSAVLKRVKSTLTMREFTMNDVSYVQFFLEDMNEFGTANSVYKEYLPQQNAASRACVQLPPSSPHHPTKTPTDFTSTSIDCLAVRGSRREVLHVQSISEWAPCCIGPYSQATKVNQLLWLAGQIGLNPGTMTLVPDLRHQLLLSFRHCSEVLHSMRSSMDFVLSAIVFWSEAAWRNEQTRIQRELLPLATELFHFSTSNSSAASSARHLSRPSLIHLVVAKLPRNAAVEVQLIGQSSLSPIPIRMVDRQADYEKDFQCQTQAVISDHLLLSHWSTISIMPSASSTLTNVHPAATLIGLVTQLFDELIRNITVAHLRWRHLLIVRFYVTPAISITDLRHLFGRICREQHLTLPAISFIPVAELSTQPSATNLSTASTTSTSSTAPSITISRGLCSLHVIAMSRQMASRDFNPLRIDSDDEAERDEEERKK